MNKDKFRKFILDIIITVDWDMAKQYMEDKAEYPEDVEEYWEDLERVAKEHGVLPT